MIDHSIFEDLQAKIDEEAVVRDVCTTSIELVNQFDRSNVGTAGDSGNRSNACQKRLPPSFVPSYDTLSVCRGKYPASYNLETV